MVFGADLPLYSAKRSPDAEDAQGRCRAAIVVAGLRFGLVAVARISGADPVNRFAADSGGLYCLRAQSALRVSLSLACTSYTASRETTAPVRFQPDDRRVRCSQLASGIRADVVA